MRCNAARVFIQETLDGPLSPPDEAMLEAHVAGCEPCRNYRLTLCRIATGLGKLESCGAPRDFGATVTFQLAREKRRRQWAPIAAAAVVVAGFLTVRPLLGGPNFQLASQDLAQPVLAGQPAGSVRASVGLPGGSILDAVPARPDGFLARSRAEAPPGGSGLFARGAAPGVESAGMAPAARRAADPALVAVAPAPLAALQLEERGAAPFALAPAAPPAEAPAEAESLAAADAALPEALAKKEESGGRSIASLPAGAAPGAGMSAYRTDSARKSRAPVTRRAPTPEEQMAVDMATFEMLRWMDPAADGGPHLEVQEADFTLP